MLGGSFFPVRFCSVDTHAQLGSATNGKRNLAIAEKWNFTDCQYAANLRQRPLLLCGGRIFVVDTRDSGKNVIFLLSTMKSLVMVKKKKKSKCAVDRPLRWTILKIVITESAANSDPLFGWETMFGTACSICTKRSAHPNINSTTPNLLTYVGSHNDGHPTCKNVFREDHKKFIIEFTPFVHFFFILIWSNKNIQRHGCEQTLCRFVNAWNNEPKLTKRAFISLRFYMIATA